MKIQNSITQTNIPSIKERNNKNNKQYPNIATPTFTGAVDVFLRFLDTNQAWGANAVDLCFMVTPRTVTDFTRGADAGVETMRREGCGTANHSSIGLYGSLAGLLFATGINNAFQLGKNDIKAHSIFADSETLDLHGRIFNEKLKSGTPEGNVLKEYLTETLQNYKALSPTEDGKWIDLDKSSIDKAVAIIEQEIAGNKTKLSKSAAEDARAILVSKIGAENNLKIIALAGEKEHTSRYTIDSIIENCFKLGKTFSKEKVKEAFKNSADTASNEFLKAMKSMNLKRSLLGIGIGSAIGVSIQPLNMYLTKLKTGNSGFVGGGEEDKSLTFKLKKLGVAGLFGAGVLATIGNPKNLIKNLQFKGMSPTINQFKFIYGVTIMSRFLAARNDNELKEATIKDVLGFANWLLLGNFVQKLVAQSLDKSLIKRNGQGAINWIKNSVLKTRDEVLFANLGEKAFKDGKAIGYNKMVEIADKATKAKLTKLSIAQILGYVYSGLVLGYGIPKLNIYLTKRRMAKQAEQEALKQEPAKVTNDIMFEKNNMDFLKKSFTASMLTK